MSRKLLVQTLSVVALVFLAGCTAQNPGKVASTGTAVPVIAPPADVDEATCGLEGFVGDESFAPIAGADVGIQGTDHQTKTAQDGRFTFSFIDAGSLTVVVAALGFETESRRVPCEVGAKITDLVFSLKELPKVGEQYIKVVPLVGRIGCAFGFAGVPMPDKCGGIAGTSLPPLDAQTKSKFLFELDVGMITSAYLEMKWTTTSGAAGGPHLELAASNLGFGGAGKFNRITYCPTTKAYQPTTPLRVAGTSVLCFTVKAETDDGTLRAVQAAKASREAILTVDANPGTQPSAAGFDDTGSRLVYQQPFEIYASFFYHGKPIPDGYKVFGE